MSDWVEFKCIKDESNWEKSKVNIEPLSIRVYNIGAVIKSSSDSCVIILDNDKGTYYSAVESYEEVMKKIEEAEGPGPIIEHFTKNEYRLILETMERVANPSESVQNIINVLKEILKEND